jgi:hypothetical protein
MLNDKSARGEASVAQCKYCGQNAGWFKEVHEACANASRKGCSEILSVVSSAVAEGKSYADIRPKVEQAKTEGKIPAEDFHAALVNGLSSGAEKLGLAEPLSEDKHSGFLDFIRDAGLTQQELVKTNGYKAAVSSMVLWYVLHGRIAEIADDQQHPFNLQSGEIPIMMFGSVVYSQETVSRSRQGGYAGASLPLGHGIYYHFGGFQAHTLEKTSLKEIDYGRFLLTTQNMYFGGDHKTFRLPYDHVVRFEPYSDGLGIFRDSASAKPEVFTVANPFSAVGWFLFNLTHFLAQPEAHTLYSAARK